jgi:glycosyltransferase involved in cell wall biosynthesis
MSKAVQLGKLKVEAGRYPRLKVLALTRYGALGVTSRIRFHQYIPHLQKANIEVSVRHFLDDLYVEQLHEKGHGSLWSIARAYFRRLRQLLSVGNYDLIWIEKEVLPWLPAFPEWWMRSVGIPYVVDYDDATFHGYDLNSRAIVRALMGKKIDRVMRCASMVAAGNDYLADRARSAGAATIEYLPTVVDLNRYPIAPHKRSGTFTIGWIGSAWTARYLPMVEPALRQVCQSGAARVLLIGSGPVDLSGVPVDVEPWSEQDEYSQIRRCDAGIMPLPDNPFERGKCGYKLIQYMACSLPVVASAAGVNSRIVTHGHNGFLASNEAEWVWALEQLRDNAELRESMGKRGRSKVEAEYSLQMHAPRLAALLRKAVTQPPAS